MMTGNRKARLLVWVAVAALAGPLLAERGDDSDRKSKNGMTTGTIDGVEVAVEFGRPSVKGRDLWGGLVPYGKIWRTGADEATTISFSSDVEVGGEVLPAGTYSLFTVPGESEWQVVFNKVAKQWGAYKYDPDQDALRVTVHPRAADHMESLDFEIDGAEVVMRWGEIAVPVVVAAAN